MNAKIVAAIALSLTGCAELRRGWVRVDFIEGHVAPEMVCSMWVNPNADIEAKCASLKAVQEELEKIPKKKTDQL